MGTQRTPDDNDGHGMIEYGILLGTLALGVVLTLVAIGAQFRTIVTETPSQQHIGEP